MSRRQISRPHFSPPQTVLLALISCAICCSSQPVIAQNGQSIPPGQSAETAPTSPAVSNTDANAAPGPICFSFNLEQMVRVGQFSNGKMTVTKWNYAWEPQKVPGTSRTTAARIPKKETLLVDRHPQRA